MKGIIANQIKFKRGPTIFTFKILYKGGEVEIAQRDIVNGEPVWRVDDVIGKTREEAAAKYITNHGLIH